MLGIYNDFNPTQDEPFWRHSRMRVAKNATYLKSVLHIQQ